MGCCCCVPSHVGVGAPRAAINGDASEISDARRAGISDHLTSIPLSSLGEAMASSMGVKGIISASLGTDSMDQFAAPNQTFIVFDWDDTILPSSQVHPRCFVDTAGRLTSKLTPAIQRELRELCEQAVALFKTAKECGDIVIVTHAQRPWVEMSCKHFLPQLWAIVKDIRVLYASEVSEQHPMAATNMVKEGASTPEEVTRHERVQTKASAMKVALASFYSQYPHQSWKNIVSIGDAVYEHDAIRQVVSQRVSTKTCRTKCLKLVERPAVETLAIELGLLRMWMPKIVEANADVDMDFSADSEKLGTWAATYGPGDPLAPPVACEPDPDGLLPAINAL